MNPPIGNRYVSDGFIFIRNDVYSQYLQYNNTAM